MLNARLHHCTAHDGVLSTVLRPKFRWVERPLFLHMSEIRQSDSAPGSPNAECLPLRLGWSRSRLTPTTPFQTFVCYRNDICEPTADVLIYCFPKRLPTG